MGFLLLSIVFSSFVFVIFKWFDKKNINLATAITGNYLTCIATAFVLNKGFNFNTMTLNALFACLGLGILFFTVFFLMGKAAAIAGVGISSAAAKLSLIIPVLVGALLLNEPYSIGKFIGLILAILAVFLISKPNKKESQNSKKGLLLLVMVFIGSGLVDTLINQIQIMFSKENIDEATGVSVIFFGALCTSLIYKLIIRQQIISDQRSLVFGLMLGVPNYFSIYCLVLALGTKIFPSNQFYLINNVSIMLLSFLGAYFFFKETINKTKITGITMAIYAIYLSML